MAELEGWSALRWRRRRMEKVMRVMRKRRLCGSGQRESDNGAVRVKAYNSLAQRHATAIAVFLLLLREQ